MWLSVITGCLLASVGQTGMDQFVRYQYCIIVQIVQNVALVGVPVLESVLIAAVPLSQQQAQFKPLIVKSSLEQVLVE